MDRGAVRREQTAEIRRGSRRPRSTRSRSAPAVVVGAEPPRPVVCQLFAQPVEVRGKRRDLDRPAARPVTVDAFRRDRRARSRRRSRTSRVAWRRPRRDRAGARWRRGSRRRAPSTSRRCDPTRRSRRVSRSHTTIRSDGSARSSAYAVHRPVYPAPTIATSAVRSAASAGRDAGPRLGRPAGRVACHKLAPPAADMPASMLPRMIRSETREHVVIVTIDNPPVNALPVAGWFQLADALRAAGPRPATRGRDPAGRRQGLPGRGRHQGARRRPHERVAHRRQPGVLRGVRRGLRLRGSRDRRGATASASAAGSVSPGTPTS